MGILAAWLGSGLEAVRFIVDAQLPPALAKWLRDRGHDAIAVREVDPARIVSFP